MTFTDDQNQTGRRMSHLRESSHIHCQTHEGVTLPQKPETEGHPQRPGHMQDFGPRRTLPVPLPGCPPHILNLVKHLHSKHVELKKDRMDREIQALKRAAAISKLAALWATEPDPPMVSVLDLPDNQAQQNDPEAGIILCQKRTCVNARLRVRQLEQELADVRTVSENTQQLCILSMINLFQ